MTHTYAILEVSRACFGEIKRKLRQAGYDDQFHDQDGRLVLDMHGIALRSDAPTRKVVRETPDRVATDEGESSAMRILLVVGPRPEIIKMSPIYRALRAMPVDSPLCWVGQQTHEAMAPLDEFGMKVDEIVPVHRDENTLAEALSWIVQGVDRVLAALRPDLVLVQGDTTTTVGAALAAFYRQIPVGHVEAGLRSGRATEPFPEEMNRRLISQMASIHFAPTMRAEGNLHEEIRDAEVYLTGNPIVDVLTAAAPHLKRDWPRPRPLVLVTCHRRERIDERLKLLMEAVHILAASDEAPQIVWPVHPAPALDASVRSALGATANVTVTGPQGYGEFIRLMARAALVVTDSGGVIEEATTLGIPLLIIRDVTERPEALEHGARLVPLAEMHTLSALMAEWVRKPMTGWCPVFGNGHAGERIARLAVDYCRRAQ